MGLRWLLVSLYIMDHSFQYFEFYEEQKIMFYTVYRIKVFAITDKMVTNKCNSGNGKEHKIANIRKCT